MKMLSRDEMKNLMGGTGTCAALVGGVVVTGLSQLEASTAVSQAGDHWCCASCSTASWMQQP